MNRYQFCHRKPLYWLVVKEFPLERYFIKPGDIIRNPKPNGNGSWLVQIEGSEYTGGAGLGNHGHFPQRCKPIYE